MVTEPTPPPALLADLAPADVDVDAMLSRFAAETLERPPTLRQRLAELPLGQKRAASAVAMGLIAAIWLGAVGLRSDAPLTAAWAAVAVTLAALAAAPFLASTRPLWAPPPRWSELRLALGLAALPALAATLPGVWPGDPTGLGVHALCFGNGLVLAALLTAAPLALQAGRLSAARLALAGASAGLIAFAFQELHCPYGGLAHVLLTHGSLGAALVLPAALMAVRRRVGA